tara:strand:+ start:1329 stop:2360 length:1032 start_codon:yes stop_codon:yes gene_type:complete
MTAFETAWELLKAILPDLPYTEDEMNTFRGRSYNMYADRNAKKYEMGLSPDVARRLVAARREMLENEGNMNYFDSLPRTKGLPQLMSEFSRQPDLFNHPTNVLSRIGSRHGNNPPVPFNTFEQAMLSDDNKEEHSVMDSYIDQAENADSFVTAGSGAINPDGKIDEIMMNPGFGGQGFGQHMLGAMLQDTGVVGDNSFSPSGRSLMQSLGHKLTRGGDINSYRVSPNSKKSILETKLNDFRFSQPYTGWREPSIDDLAGSVVPPSEHGHPNDENEIYPPRTYPYEYERMGEQSYRWEDGELVLEPTHEKLKNTFPLGITYTGEKGKPAVTNSLFNQEPHHYKS